MTKPNEVFLVTQGEYSDYHILAAFSTRELAEKYAAHYPNGSVEIDTLSLDVAYDYPQGKLLHQVYLGFGGNTLGVWQVDPDRGPSDADTLVYNYLHKTVNAFIWAKNESDAVQIAKARWEKLTGLREGEPS